MTFKMMQTLSAAQKHEEVHMGGREGGLKPDTRSSNPSFAISDEALAPVWILSAPVFTSGIRNKEKLGKQGFETESCANHSQVAPGRRSSLSHAQEVINTLFLKISGLQTSSTFSEARKKDSWWQITELFALVLHTMASHAKLWSRQKGWICISEKKAWEDWPSHLRVERNT